MQNRNALRGGGGAMNRKKGQSILEYVIVLTAIVGVIVVGAAMFAKPGEDGRNQGVGKIMDTAAKKITNSTANLANMGIGATGPQEGGVMFKRGKGQSILEYVIVLIAIVACVVFASKWISDAVRGGMTNAQTAVENSAKSLAK